MLEIFFEVDSCCSYTGNPSKCQRLIILDSFGINVTFLLYYWFAVVSKKTQLAKKTNIYIYTPDHCGSHNLRDVFGECVIIVK